MIQNAFIKIWGKTIGAVAWDENTNLGNFQYIPSFYNNGWELAPLKMPLDNGQQIFYFSENKNNNTFKGLPGLLADTLPDRYGNQLINSWLAQNGRPANSMNPVELLCFIGTRGMGALEFEPAQFSAPTASFNIELDGLVTYAQKLLNNKIDFKTNLKEDDQQALLDILKVGTSAGGARPKAIIAYNKKSGEVRSGQTKVPKGFEHWLIKLDGVSDAQFGASYGYGRVEMAYYLMAIDCGINMMESRLLEENKRAHFLTKRFDRTANNTKHHVQTFCAIQHFDYDLVGQFSYEQLFQTMRQLRLDYTEAQELYRRMVFNVISRNCDDHTKNFAFMMEKDGPWKLAPAYDICHAYRPESQWVSQHALSLNGIRKAFTIADLLSVAKQMNIKKPKQIIDQITTVVQSWDQYAKQVNLEKKLSKAIKKTHLLLK